MRLPNYPISVLEAAGGILHSSSKGPHLIIAGGYISNSNLQTTRAVHALQLHSPSAKWQMLAPMPLYLTHCAQVAVGDALYICGGFLGNAPGRSVSNCFRYSLDTNRWEPLPSLPVVSGGGGMVYIGQKRSLFFASGTDRPSGKFGGKDLSDSFMLSLDNLAGGWVRKAPLSNARNHMAAVSARGRYFFVGGQHKEDEKRGNQATVEEYRWRTNAWVKRSDIPLPLGHVAASTVQYKSGFLVVGGITQERRLHDAVLYYDVLTDKWKNVGVYPRKVQSPICGVLGLTLHCATGQGGPGTAAFGYSRRLSPLIQFNL